MGRIRPVVALVLVVLVLASASCGSMTPPDWAWFDVDRRPLGAFPAQVGFYAGEIVFYPFAVVFAPLLGRPDLLFEPQGMQAMGTLTGFIVGAPFHLIGLPFGDRGGDEAAPPEDDGGPGRADDEWAEEYGR